MRFTGRFFSLKFIEAIFVSSSYNSISSWRLITESPIIFAKNLFSQLHVAEFQIKSRFLHLHQIISLFHHSLELHFLPSNLHLHSHDTCFVNLLLASDPIWRHLICMHLEKQKVPQRRSAHVFELVFSRNNSFQSLKMATECMWSKE